MRTTNPELLAPAGNMESLTAAVSMGCDAIYAGGHRFNARAGADNFTEAEMEEAIDYCHLRGVKVFTAVNTLYKDKELADVLRFVETLYTMGADAFILQDIGLARLIKLSFPDARLHASTQMTAHSLRDVLFLKEAGFDRVVLSRELSLEEVKAIAGHAAGLEIEVFIHGALCVSYSGQCLMSHLIGGRSGNRGSCAGPCRQRYTLFKKNQAGGENRIREGYLLSPRDLMTLDLIQALTEAGVASFKIEGRMRSPEYVAQAVKCYRQVLDYRSESLPDTERNKLVRIFNRGGSSTAGYLQDQAGPGMMSVDTPKATGEYIGYVQSYDPKTGLCGIKLIPGPSPVIPGDGIEIWTKASAAHCGTYINKQADRSQVTVMLRGPINPGDKVYRTYDKALHDELKMCQRNERKLSLSAAVTAKKGCPLTLRLWHGALSLTFQGAIVEKAATRPLSSPEIIGRLMKTGATPFTLSFEEVEIEEDIFIDIKELNRLRRDALEVFAEKWVAGFKRPKPHVLEIPESKEERQTGIPKMSTLVCTKEQYLVALEKGVDRLYMEISERFSPSELAGHFAALPRIDRVDPKILITRLEETEIEGFLARTWGQLECLRHTKKIVAADYSLPVFNRAARIYLKNFCQTYCLSPELASEERLELADESAEIIVYGRPAAMVTRLCPVGNYVGRKDGYHCDEKNKQGYYFLRDKTGAEFPLRRDCPNCLCFILSDRPVSLSEQAGKTGKFPAGFIRLDFTIEDGTLTKRLLSQTNAGV